MPDSGCRHLSPSYSRVEADAFLLAVESFVLQGARWMPDLDRNEVRMTRDTLLALGEQHVVRLFKMLDEHGAAKREDLKTLFAADRMKPMLRAVKRILRWV
jgi:hypothetical protein